MTRVLYIEDNIGDADLLEAYLTEIESFSFDLSIAESMQSALEIINSESFDMIFLDLGLPDCDGVDCIDKINEAFPNACLVILTGNNNIELGKYAVKNGAQDYLQKRTLDPDLLEKTIYFALKRNQQNDYLLEAVKTKDKLLSILAHDLRGPLGNIIGLSDLIHDSVESVSNEELKELIRTQNQVSISLYELLENLLQWSKINLKTVKAKAQRMDVNELVERVISLNNGSARLKSILLNYHRKDPFIIESDPYLLQTALRNLVSNAVKFTRPNGTVDIEIEDQDDYILIKVRDNGIGIPQSLLPGLFNPAVKSNRPGTKNEPSSGLGLVLVSEISKILGGSIEVKSSENQGSTFSLLVKNFKK